MNILPWSPIYKTDVRKILGLEVRLLGLSLIPTSKQSQTSAPFYVSHDLSQHQISWESLSVIHSVPGPAGLCPVVGSGLHLQEMYPLWTILSSLLQKDRNGLFCRFLGNQWLSGS